MVVVGIVFSVVSIVCLILSLHGAGNRVYPESGIMALVGIGFAVIGNGFLNG